MTKTCTGRGNVENTNDSNDPVSTATQAALNMKATPTDITNKFVGLGNVDNTAIE